MYVVDGTLLASATSVLSVACVVPFTSVVAVITGCFVVSNKLEDNVLCFFSLSISSNSLIGQDENARFDALIQQDENARVLTQDAHLGLVGLSLQVSLSPFAKKEL